MFEAKLAPGGKGWLDEPGTENDHNTDCVRYSEWLNIQNSEYNDDDYSDIPDVESEDMDDFDEDFAVDEQADDFV